MAGFVYELMAKLGLDTTEFDNGLNQAGENAEKGGSKIGNAMKTGMKVVGTAIATAGAAVTAFAGSSVQAGMSFDSAMSNVAATMGVTVDDLTQGVGTAETSFGHFEGNLREFAQFLGSNTAFSATQAAEALNYMALAGYDAQQSMDMLPNVLSLAAAGGIDLAYASDMVTDAQSALGLKSEETAELVDKMAMASSKTNTSVGQLGEAILTVGGTAKNLAGGTTELTQALGLLADNGIKGAEGGTALRNMILSLSAPTEKAAALMKKLGLEVFDAQGNMRPLNEIFGDLNDKLATMTQEGRTNVLNEIFNKVDLKSANALLGTSAERWDEVAGAIDNAQGAAAQMAATKLDNLAGDVTLFQSALEGAKIAISDQLTPSLREFVQYGTSAVSELGTAFREDGLEGALNAIGPIIDQGISLLFDALPRILEAATALLEALVNGIITNLPKLVPAIVQLIQTIVQSISENLPQLLDAAIQIISALADGLIEMLPELIPAIVQIILTIVEKLTEPDTILQLIDAAFKILGALAEGMIKAIPELIKAVPQIIQNLIEAFTQLFPQLVESGKELLGRIKEGFTEAFPGFLEKARETATQIHDSIKQKWEAAKATGNLLMTKLQSGVSEKASALQESVTKIAKNAHDSISKTWNNAKTLGANLITKIRSGIAEKVGEITSQIQSLKESIQRIFQGLADAAASWGRDLIGGFVDGLQEKLQALKDKAVSIAQQIKDVIGFSEPKEGPLSNFHTYAPDMMELFAKGITDNADLVTRAIGNSFDLRDQIGAGFNGGTVVGTGRSTPIGGSSRNQTVVLQVGRTELGRLVYELYNEEVQRMGVKLAVGGIA